MLGQFDDPVQKLSYACAWSHQPILWSCVAAALRTVLWKYLSALGLVGLKGKVQRGGVRLLPSVPD